MRVDPLPEVEPATARLRLTPLADRDANCPNIYMVVSIR
jgi:hypothetical protein